MNDSKSVANFKVSYAVAKRDLPGHLQLFRETPFESTLFTTKSRFIFLPNNIVVKF